jgi:ribosomal protein S2
MTSTEPTKMQTKRVKSPSNSQVFQSPRSQKTSGFRRVDGGRILKKNPPKGSKQTSGTAQKPSNFSPGLNSSKPLNSQNLVKKKIAKTLHDSFSAKPFLKTPLKSDVKVSVKNSFFANFLMTKGHLGSPKWTKDMTNSLQGVRQGFAVFDASQTKIACSRAFHFLKTYRKPLGEHLHKKKLDILFVNTSEQYRHLIQKVARITHQRYIHEKWVGGTLTNWSQISQSYSLFGRFHSLFGNFLKKRKIHLPLYEKARRIYSGLLPQETQKKKITKGSEISFTTSSPELLSIEKKSKESQILEQDHMSTQIPLSPHLLPDETLDQHEESQKSLTLEGLKPSVFHKWNDGLPDVIFLINPEENQNVLREANLLKIPVIALTDSNTKISGIDYMIPGNVQSIKFVYWFLNCMTIILQKRNKRTKKKSKTLTLQTSTTQ